MFEAVSRSGTDWIWNEDPSIDIADLVDDIDIVDIGVSVGSIDNCGEFWHEYTGERLPSEEVARARSDEIDGLKHYKVIEKAPIEECWNKIGKTPIGVRWVIVAQGDEVNTGYRARLVAKEFKADERLTCLQRRLRLRRRTVFH